METRKRWRCNVAISMSLIGLAIAAWLNWVSDRDKELIGSSGTNLQVYDWWNQPLKQQQYRPCSWWKNKPALQLEGSNGFLIVDCNGGLNQMRRDFCDGVGIARLLNATLLLPQFEGTPYWNDSSGFADIFDADYFMERISGHVRVVKELPPELSSKQPFVVDCQKKKNFDYVEALLPLLLEHKVLIIRPAASQRSDRYSTWAKSSRCQACYRALRLVKHLQEKAELVIRAMPRPFVALHLRFEPDMIAYSRCHYANLSSKSLEAIEAARRDQKKAPFTGQDAAKWRSRGKCPLTPQETAFILQSLRLPTTMPVYLASGSGLLEAEDFTNVYTNTYRKSTIMAPELLTGLHGNSRAALDYYIAVASDVYIATYFGNMDKMVVAMRVLNGHKKTVVLSRSEFAKATAQGLRGSELALRMWQVHRPSLSAGDNLPLPDCFCRR